MNHDKEYHMQEQLAIIETVNAIFDLVDAKDWAAVRALIADEVDVDVTSLGGGEPARITGDQLVAGWETGLHARKRSWHLVGHHRLRVADDAATAAVLLKGYAWNRLDEELGSGMWEVWGTYHLSFERAETGWKMNRFQLDVSATNGDDAVRTHIA
ncbi:nuclear transport factor 2 family protein [Dactylosporangium cerinum]|uniref:Nuclear transport factor 2 family protein n=1 Tax=Dactylosporangium cerinum TaxID=1434730 RepID=A0ABV9W2J6_9ACTN